MRFLTIAGPLLAGAAALVLCAQEPHAPVSQPAQTPGGQHPSPQPTPAGGTHADVAKSFFGLSAAPDPEKVANGQKLFVASCGFCHGTNANGGNSGPDLVRSVLVLHDEGSGKEIGPVILNGRPDKGMPKFNFTEAQIKDLAAFFLSRSQSTANRMDYKILNVVTGNATQGETYFNGHCASCHSGSGDLAHIAAKYEPVALQGRFLFPVTSHYPGQPGPAPDPRAQANVTVTLPSGQSYSGVLDHIDDFTVTLTDSSGEHHSVPLNPEDTGGKSAVKVEIRDPLAGHEKLLKQYTDADMHNILAYLETLK